MKKLPGYIAITTVIILSSVLLLVMVAFTYISILSRITGATAMLKEKTRAAAESCTEEARLKLALSSSYTGNETVSIQSGTEAVSCTILSIATSGSNKVIRVSASLVGVADSPVTNLELTVDSSSLESVSLEEKVAF
jgi:hypothetical protein